MRNGELRTSVVDGQLQVDQADPEIFLAKSLLDELEKEAHPDVSLANDVLELRAINGTFRYRLDHGGWDRWSGEPGRVALLEPQEATNA